MAAFVRVAVRLESRLTLREELAGADEGITSTSASGPLRLLRIEAHEQLLLKLHAVVQRRSRVVARRRSAASAASTALSVRSHPTGFRGGMGSAEATTVAITAAAVGKAMLICCGGNARACRAAGVA